MHITNIQYELFQARLYSWEHFSYKILLLPMDNVWFRQPDLLFKIYWSFHGTLVWYSLSLKTISVVLCLFISLPFNSVHFQTSKQISCFKWLLIQTDFFIWKTISLNSMAKEVWGCRLWANSGANIYLDYP